MAMYKEYKTSGNEMNIYHDVKVSTFENCVCLCCF